MTTALVEASRLQTTCSRILQHADIPPTDADFVALSLTEADLRGIHSHGSMRLGRYVRELREGITNPRPEIRCLEEGPAFARIDGDGGLGQLVGRQSMEVCITKARQAGSATVTACRSRHFGAAGFFALMALEHDFIGLTLTVASPRLAPTGGTLPLFGNNPLAMAIPGNGDFPLLVDFATGSIAAGNLELAAASGTPIPAGVARDLEGNPTTDPKVALQGTIVPIAEHKGYGLTLLIEVLAGLLGGSPYFGVEKKQADAHVRDKGIGHFFMALDPSRFMPLPQFKAAVGQMVTRTKASPRMPGAREILLPGELEARRRQERLAQGIPLAASTVEMLNKLGRECGAQL
ncbi:MAG: Ldh family oxidoreductase [Candidatus Latescibacteria bacterium]|nr:Ldh family oxidoreductase [Candidatus Latescibacterota bacterium]